MVFVLAATESAGKFSAVERVKKRRVGGEGLRYFISKPPHVGVGRWGYWNSGFKQIISRNYKHFFSIARLHIVDNKKIIFTIMQNNRAVTVYGNGVLQQLY